ncbi:MAG TPA: TIGR02757 family protein [Thermoanaerobaculia bacterium]|nr:TIGR02757 family protein [Thermoanaerobaculia bacterium]
MRRRRPVRNAGELRERLDRLATTFDISTIAPDPLQLVHRWRDPRDQEVVAILAAAFAYGRADIIVSNIGAMLARMKPSPYQYLAQRGFLRAEARARFAGFSHRFHKTPELVALLERLAAALVTHGSLGALFRTGYDDSAADIASSLARFVDAIRGAVSSRSAHETAAIEYLLSSPEDGSACKRMNLFLRWMVRRTSPDLGLWTFVDPAKLVMPVDTHVHRIATFLGLNDRKSTDWKTARALTDRLAALDPADPVRYDFALCRLGILDLCSRRRRKEQCDVCLLRDVCRFPVE